MTYYGVADVFNIHNNYEGVQWNVLSSEEARSTAMWGKLTDATDLQYQKTLITNDQHEIDKFVRAHMAKWAADPNLYNSTLTQLQMLRADYKMQNKDYDNPMWTKMIDDYYKLIIKNHGA